MGDVDNVIFRNLVAYEGGLGPPYCGNQTIDHVIMDRAPGKWITACSSVASSRVYGNVSITNSVFRWGPDDITDYPKAVFYFTSPTNQDTDSPIVSRNSTTMVVWGQVEGTFPVPIFEQNRFRMTTAQNNYVLDGTGTPYMFTMMIPNQTPTIGITPQWVFGSTSYYQLVITADQSGAFDNLPNNGTLNYYSLQAAMNIHLYVRNSSFGPGHSHAFYMDFPSGVTIRDSTFVDIEFGGITGETGSEGSQAINILIDNNLFVQHYDSSLQYSSRLPDINLYPLNFKQTDSAAAGAEINVTVSNNVFYYTGTQTLGGPNFNDAMVFGGMLNLKVVNNTVYMNASASTGYGIYVVHSGNVYLCNNTITGAPTESIYVDSTTTFNVTTCGGVPYVQPPLPASGVYKWNLPLNTSSIVDAINPSRVANVGGAACSAVFGVFGSVPSMYLPCTGLQLTVPYATMSTSYTVQLWMMLDGNASLGANHWINSQESNTGFSSLLQFAANTPPYFGITSPIYNYQYAPAGSFPNGLPIGWHQYGFTYNDPTAQYASYIDGVMVTQTMAYTSWNASNPLPSLQIGSDINPMYFHDFVCWTSARNASQMLNDFLHGQGSTTGTHHSNHHVSSYAVVAIGAVVWPNHNGAGHIVLFVHIVSFERNSHVQRFTLCV